MIRQMFKFIFFGYDNVGNVQCDYVRGRLFSNFIQEKNYRKEKDNVE